jgi:hypothetical protein
MSTKRFRVITVAAAGTLTLATAISAAAVTLPSAPALASTALASTTPSNAALAGAGDAFLISMSHRQAAAQTVQTAHTERSAAASGMQQVILFDRMRSMLGEREQLAAARKAAAAKAAEHKAAGQAAAGQRAAAQQAAAQATPAEQPPSQTPSTQPTQPVQQVPVTTPSGSPQQIAEQMLSQFGWSSSQFSCLEPLWEQESGWDLTAENPSSGAYGIPQTMPGSEMASAGPDWQTDATTQIRWGLTYIQGRYGSPCGAWAHEESDGWY